MNTGENSHLAMGQGTGSFNRMFRPYNISIIQYQGRFPDSELFVFVQFTGCVFLKPLPVKAFAIGIAVGENV